MGKLMMISLSFQDYFVISAKNGRKLIVDDKLKENANQEL
jgi:hypothetical protein